MTDNANVQFTVSAADATGSTFAAADAGGAASSITGDDNRIEVTSTQLEYYTNATNTDLFAAMSAVSIKATDANGNSTTASFNITVTDVEPPEVVTRAITVALDANGEYTIQPEDVDVGSNDACGVTLTLDNNAFNCNTLGENTVMLTATDPSGNSSNMIIVDRVSSDSSMIFQRLIIAKLE